jgi:dephospho-CoA kinase
MILFGLTGGIGSGKSSVSELLREHGAVIVDGDQIARSLQVPGSPAVDEIGTAFAGVVDAEGRLDRGKLAKIVFADPSRLAELNRIMLPKIQAEIERQIEQLRGSDSIVVLDLPLLAEHPRTDLDGVIVVDLDHEIAVQRLVSGRGLTKEDARARITHQASREERRRIADVVIDNSGTMQALQTRVGEVWRWMVDQVGGVR